MKRTALYLVMIVFIMCISWEYQQEVSASLLEGSLNAEQDIIPADALRLRVLANSDHPQDQWLKREVRDAVIKEVLEWVEHVDSVEEAEAEIKHSLQQLELVVQETIARSGYAYPFTLEYGSILFPAKLYGQQYYPAGEYQGLLITIGAGQGDNWWCVLFPPLCFVDFGTGEVIDPDQEFADETDEQTKTAIGDKSANVDGADIEVRFFLVELFLKIKSLFV